MKRQETQESLEVREAFKWLECVRVHRYSFSESRAALSLLAKNAPQSECAQKIIAPVLEVLNRQAYVTAELSEALRSVQRDVVVDFLMPASPPSFTPAASTQTTPERSVERPLYRGEACCRQLFPKAPQ